MKLLPTALLLSSISSLAYASGTHTGGYDGALEIGEPGDKAKITQTITVTINETADGKMLFNPAQINVRKGQTVRLSIKNKGQMDHEFVMNTEPEIMEHKAAMAKFPDMEHDEPNNIKVLAGKSQDIVWKFSNDGAFTFACLIPGHFEAGMHGSLTVMPK